MTERLPRAVAEERGQLYLEVARSGAERPFSPGIFAELGPRRVRGALLPLSTGHVAVVFELAPMAHGLAEDETRKLNAFLDSIIDNIPAMVFVKDAEHLRYEVFNRAGEALTGFRRASIYGRARATCSPRNRPISSSPRIAPCSAMGACSTFPKSRSTRPRAGTGCTRRRYRSSGRTVSPVIYWAFPWTSPSAKKPGWPWSARTRSWKCASRNARAN